MSEAVELVRLTGFERRHPTRLPGGQRSPAPARVQTPLEVSDEMKPGVASLPHGWGHDRPGTRMSTAAATPGASLNDVTDELRVDALSGNAALSGVPVTVTAAAVLS